MRGLIAVLLFVWGVAFGLAASTPPGETPGAAADASGPTHPASSDADEAPVLAPEGERFDNLAAIIAGLSRGSYVVSIALSPDGRSLASAGLAIGLPPLSRPQAPDTDPSADPRRGWRCARCARSDHSVRRRARSGDRRGAFEQDGGRSPTASGDSRQQGNLPTQRLFDARTIARQSAARPFAGHGTGDRQQPKLRPKRAAQARSETEDDDHIRGSEGGESPGPARAGACGSRHRLSPCTSGKFTRRPFCRGLPGPCSPRLGPQSWFSRG